MQHLRKLLCTTFLLIAVCSNLTSTAQVSINSDGSAPHPSAMLDINSSNKGVLIPRLSFSEIATIPNPAAGLLVYNTTDEKFYVFVASENHWKEMQFGSGTIELIANYSIGTGGSCANTVVNGNYYKNTTLNTSNYVTMETDVTSPGSWSIASDTINGYSFSGHGNFTTTGIALINLQGFGTPRAIQTDTFTINANGNGGSCTFVVTVVSDFNCGDQLSYGGQLYNTVSIGNQCWFKENLNIGTKIDGTVNQTNNGTIEKYCYNNSENNCSIYGGLYMWNEMMQYVTTEGTQGICPPGWHIPTDAEWCTMENHVDAGSVACNIIGYRGSDAGGNLKEAGTTHWKSPNYGATNSSGFTALPGGFRNENGSFSYIRDYAVLSTSSVDGTTNAFCRELDYSHKKVSRATYGQAYGFSVRCLKD